MAGPRPTECKTGASGATSAVMRRIVLCLGLLLVAPLAAPLPVAAAAAVPSEAAAASLSTRWVTEAQQYLNSITTLKARFTQVAPDGAITHGTVWLDRPGRMRFEYDPPTPLLLVAGNGLVMFRDSQLGQTSTVPLGRTPLGILLAPTVRLTGGDLTVTDVRRVQDNEVQITVVRTATPTEGSLTLTFATDPWRLRQWTVTDAQGQRTAVALGAIQTGIKIDQSLFSPTAPMTNSPTRGGGGG